MLAAQCASCHSSKLASPTPRNANASRLIQAVRYETKGMPPAGRLLRRSSDLIQNTLWWIGRTGIDGFRQDAAPYVPRRFWHDWTAAIHARFPSFKVVGEVFDTDPAVTSFFQGGRAQFDGIDTGVRQRLRFPVPGRDRAVFAGSAPLRELTKMLANDYLYPESGRLVTFPGLAETRIYFPSDRTAQAA